MSKPIYPWVKPMGLSSSDFSNKPEGEEALIWGLKRGAINEQEYVAWASQHYQLPAIKAEFFSMAVDFSLLEKYANVYNWTAHCYPIYEWQDILFIACLEPLKTEIKQKNCFVIAPFNALDSAWQKNLNNEAINLNQTEAPPIPEGTEVQSIETTEKAPIETAPLKKSAVEKPDVEGLDFGQLKDEMGVKDTPQTAVEKNQAAPEEGVGELDFSAMGDEAIAPPAPESLEEKIQEQAYPENDSKQQPVAEITQTTIDSNFNDFTSATQTMHAHGETMTATNQTQSVHLPFESQTIADISLEGDPTKIKSKDQVEDKTRITDSSPLPPLRAPDVIAVPPPLPIMETPPVPPTIHEAPEAAPLTLETRHEETALPSLDDLKAQQMENPKSAPGMQVSDSEIQTDEYSDSSVQRFADEYTPVTVITKAQQEAMAKKKQEALIKNKERNPGDTNENTITDHQKPVNMPDENRVTESDLQRVDDLENCKSFNDVIIHIFGHLKRDYKKMMWVEKKGDQLYFPKLVYGEWKILSLAWKMHINVTNPNMFRVAYKSSMPFHGDVSLNPYNEKYFEWWTRGRMPDFATIFPVVVNEELIGFITCFNKNDEFDEVASLKKIENLVSICKKSFSKFIGSLAA